MWHTLFSIEFWPLCWKFQFVAIFELSRDFKKQHNTHIEDVETVGLTKPEVKVR